MEVSDWDGNRIESELRLNVLDDVPRASDHPVVHVIEGETGTSAESGKLFTAREAGADQAKVTAINGTPLDHSNLLSSGYHRFDGQFGSFLVKPDGSWIYEASPDQINPGGNALEESFRFTLTDSNRDQSSAVIPFAIEDGEPPTFDPSSGPVPPSSGVTTDPSVLMTIVVDQECQKPPVADLGRVIVDKGSDSLLADQFRFDDTSTAVKLQAALADKNPNSQGTPIDLINLHPGSSNQSLELRTVANTPVLSLTLESITEDAEGNLSATIKILQKSSFEVNDSEPAVLPIIITASDHDGDTVAASINLKMIDAAPQAVDDSAEVIEGADVQGFLLTNDRQCMDPARVAEIIIHGADIPGSLSGDSKNYPPGALIETVYGRLKVSTDGSWLFNARDSQKNNPDPVDFQFSYVSEDSDGDRSSAGVTISIRDGAAPTGQSLGSTGLTEGFITRPPEYPVSVTSAAVVLKGDGPDPVDPGSIRYSGALSGTLSGASDQLSNKLTSLGEAVIFSQQPGVLMGKTAAGDKVISIATHKSAAQTGKDAEVKNRVELHRPLDHLAPESSSGAVKINGSEIVLSLPMTFSDFDGTPATGTGLLTITVADGGNPELTRIDRISLKEADLPASATGQLTAVPGADQLVPGSWKFSSSQPGLSGLFSEDKPLTVVHQNEKKLSLVTETAPDSNSPVLTIRLDNSPVPQQESVLNWAVILEQPMDQDKGVWPLKVAVELSDSDGDITGADLVLDIQDGGGGLEITVSTPDLSLTEPGYSASTPVSTESKAKIQAGTDNVVNAHFLTPEANGSGQVMDASGQPLKHDGQFIRYFPGQGSAIEAWSVNSGGSKDSKIFTLLCPDDNSGINIPAGKSDEVTFKILWHSFLDHLDASGGQKNSLLLPVKVEAIDTDGTSVQDSMTFTLLDGLLPIPVAIEPPGSITDINRGSINTVTESLQFTPGSDRCWPSLDIADLTLNLKGFTSDGQALDRIERVAENSITVVHRSDGNTVFKFSLGNISATTAEVVFEQLDNIDHICSSASPEHGQTRRLPVRVILIDSDKDTSEQSITVPIIVEDTVPIAEADHFNHGAAITTEPYSLDFEPERALMKNDSLGADADRARLAEVEYNGTHYPLTDKAPVAIDTPLGVLTIRPDSQWSLNTKRSVDHSAGQDRTVGLKYSITDGDGDKSSTDFSITIGDIKAIILHEKKVDGFEDQPTVPLFFEVFLGDVDRDETISKLWVEIGTLQGGKLTLNGLPLSPEPDTERVYIPPDSLSSYGENGYTIFSSEDSDIRYLPPPDGSDFSFQNHFVNLRLKAEITKTPGPDQTIRTNLPVHIKGIADPPVWSGDDQYTTQEDQDIQLLGAGAELTDTDGSETLSYEVTAVPGHMLLKLGSSVISPSRILKADQIEQLEVFPDKHWSGLLPIQFDAIATESAPFSVEYAGSPHTISVRVQPVANTPELNVAPTGSDKDTARLSGNEDQRIAVADHITASLTDNDGSETLFIRLKSLVKAGEDHGSFWININGHWVELPGNSAPEGVNLLADGTVEVPAKILTSLNYLPGKDRSSANYDDVRLKVNAVSKESARDGVNPSPGEEEAISPDKYLEIRLKGIPDQPQVLDNATWQVSPDNPMQLTGSGEEDQPLPLQFTLQSTDSDGSESLNSILNIALLEDGFEIRDSNDKQPAISSISNGKPVYQISPEELKSGHYSLYPPRDYTGKQQMSLEVFVTEPDGAKADYTFQLTAVFSPQVDTSAPDEPLKLSGKELELDSQGQFKSEGAVLSLTGLPILDSDHSEKLIDINKIDLPHGFRLLQVSNTANRSTDRYLNTDSPLTSNINLKSLKQLLADLAGDKLVFVPASNAGVMDPDFPTSRTNPNTFSMYPLIQDQQNGLTVTKEIKVDTTIRWTGEVDGEPPGPNPADENTEVSFKGPSDRKGHNINLKDIRLFSTDEDDSEVVRLGDAESPTFKISLFDKAGNIQSDGWHLSHNKKPDRLTFNQKEWLVNDDSLQGYHVVLLKPGEYRLEAKVLISDQGDLEARSARLDITNKSSGGDDYLPSPPDEILTCKDGIKGNEDEPLPLAGCVSPQADEYAEQTVFRIDTSDLPAHWGLTGTVTESWGDNGQTVSYLVLPENLKGLSVLPAEDYSGKQNIPVHILKRNKLSDKTSDTIQQLVFNVSPVVENDLTIKTTPAAEGDEWNGSNIAWPLNLDIRPSDRDGSESLVRVELTPAAGIELEGQQLNISPDGSYTMEPLAGETEQQFEQRLRTIKFIPGEGLSGNKTTQLQVTVKDSAPDIGETDEKTFSNRSVELSINPVNNCAVLTSPAAYGNEDSEIPITGLKVELKDNDGSEVFSAVLADVPAGAVLKDQSGAPLPYNGSGRWQIPGSLVDQAGNIAPITFQPEVNFSGTVNLQLISYSHEQALTAVCTDQSPLVIRVAPAGDELTLDQVLESRGNENSTIDLPLNIKTTDHNTSSTDHAERIQVNVTILQSSDATVFPPEATAEKPFLQIPGGATANFQKSGFCYLATIESSGSTLPVLQFYTGDGHGSAQLKIAARSMDSTDGFNTALGPEVSFDSTMTIAPKADRPTLQVERNSIVTSREVAVPLAIQAAVINPATTVSNLVNSELYVLIEGLPASASLVNSSGIAVGTPSTSPLGWALTSGELTGLSIKGLEAGNYNLRVTSVSDVGDGSLEKSSPATILVKVIEIAADIDATVNDDLVIADGKARSVNAMAGNDTAAAGDGESHVIPGPGNDIVWGGKLNGSGDGKKDIFLWQSGDESNPAWDIVKDFEPGIDQIDLSGMLQIQAVWDSTVLAEDLVVSASANGNAVIYWTVNAPSGTVQESLFTFPNGDTITVHGTAKQLIYLEGVPLETLIPGADSLDGAGRLRYLVENRTLVVSNQFGHEGPDELHASAAGLLLNSGADADSLFAHPNGSSLRETRVMISTNSVQDRTGLSGIRGMRERALIQRGISSGTCQPMTSLILPRYCQKEFQLISVTTFNFMTKVEAATSELLPANLRNGPNILNSKIPA